MRVTIQGPNLRDQSRGSFHIHAAGCSDNRRYGPGCSLGGDDGGWEIDADTQREVVDAIYGDQMDEGASYEECHGDLHFEPCLAGWDQG